MRTIESYDDVPYESFAIPETHPDFLACLGAMLGLSTTPAERCRVLELGSAAGGNLIPMAWYLPHSDFVGVELSQAQAGRGQAMICDLGLRNCRLIHGDILDLDPDAEAGLGRFDYILIHGVYSWVPEPVREHILALCGGLLTDNGIAYLSYNVLPGWHQRGLWRDMLLYHCRGAGSPRERIVKARELLDLVAAGFAGDERPEAEIMRREVRFLRETRISYLYHEYLEETNAPERFCDVMERAARYGLHYLADARLHTLFPSTLGAGAQAVLEGFESQFEIEQYTDFLTLRPFRRSLLVGPKAKPNLDIDLQGLKAFSAYGDLEPPADLALDRVCSESFAAHSGGGFHIEHPLTKALVAGLSAIHPNARPLPELLAQAQELVRQAGGGELADQDDACLGELFSLYCSGGLGLSGRDVQWPLGVSERPRVSRLAQAQAVAGEGHAASLRHRVLGLDPLSEHLIGLLDGRRDREDLVQALLKILDSQPELAARIRQADPDSGADLGPAVRANLDRLLAVYARNGLLEG